ncbi:hypothetical protein [Actinomadura sp. 6N118]|uniref:hypothetical protein n=1 Tax=Actinomadura sp. 6N118 TaxID=3375151 RepID=UPI0037A0281F
MAAQHPRTTSGWKVPEPDGGVLTSRQGNPSSLVEGDPRDTAVVPFQADTPQAVIEFPDLDGSAFVTAQDPVANQVNQALAAWSGAAVPKIRALIAALDVPAERKSNLFRINAGRAWFRSEYTTTSRTGGQDGGGVFTATLEDLALARRLAEQALRIDHPFPNLARVRTMLFDGPIAQREDSAGATNGGSFAWWLRISRLPGAGAPVRIPLQTSRYFDAQAGELSSVVQVAVSDGDGADDGEVTIRLVKTSPKSQPRTQGEVVGLDWGLCNLLTTSHGQRLGQALYPWLRARDAELTTLQARLSQRGVRFRDSKRWRNLTKRIRRYAENEIGRILNRLTAHDIRELVVEDLDFRGKGLSATLRRLPRRTRRPQTAPGRPHPGPRHHRDHHQPRPHLPPMLRVRVRPRP